MQPAQLRAADGRLSRFLGALTPLLGRVERQTHASEYVRGLLLDGERKSITPMADRVPGSDMQALRQFVNQSPWAWAPLQAALTTLLLDRLLPEAVLILDETSFPKKGDQSVGVARQYCGALGKTANCQVAVSVHLGTDTACLPLTWGLYLPQAWIDDPVRRTAARVPDDVRYQTKNDLALAALDRVRAWGVGARVVLADAGYGTSQDFRAALTARGLPYCVQVASSVKGWTTAPPTTRQRDSVVTRSPRAGGRAPGHGVADDHVARRDQGPIAVPLRGDSVLAGARCQQSRATPDHAGAAVDRVATRPRRHPSNTGWRRSATKPWDCAVSCASRKAGGAVSRTTGN